MSARESRPMWWTPRQVAERLQVSRSTVDRWIESGQLRASVLPGAGRGLRQQKRVADSELRAFEAALAR